MAGDSIYWLILAAALANRWLISWALSQITVSALIGLCLMGLLWQFQPILARVGSSEIQYWLATYKSEISVLVCIESWLIATLLPGRAYFSPASLLGILYLQAKLFQSGALSASFGVQTAIFAVALLLIMLLNQKLVRSFIVKKYYLPFHTTLIWLVCWLGFCSWSDSSAINSSEHLGDTVRVIAAIPVAVIVSIVCSVCWEKVSRSFRGTG